MGNWKEEKNKSVLNRNDTDMKLLRIVHILAPNRHRLRRGFFTLHKYKQNTRNGMTTIDDFDLS